MKRFPGRLAGLVSTVLLLVISLSLWSCINQGPIYALTPTTAEFLPLQTVPAGLASLRAKDCGECHQAIYAEWQGSMHAKSYSSPFFSAYHKKDRHEISCLVCHTPLQNQLEKLVTYNKGDYQKPLFEENPGYDAELKKEGVTCAACHVRDGVVYGPYREDQLNAPHPVQYDARFQSEELCLQCHQVPARPFSLVRYGVCSTGEEFSESPWSEQGFICQDCHMEKVHRPLAKGSPARTVRMHNWQGGYSKQQLQKAFAFSARREGKRIRVTISNSGAGHKVPTGDPDQYIELDFIWIAQGGAEKIVKHYKFKRQIVWQPVMFELYDNRLAAGESDSFVFSADGAGELVVRGTYSIMTDWSLERLKKNHGLTNAPDIHRPFLDERISVN